MQRLEVQGDLLELGDALGAAQELGLVVGQVREEVPVGRAAVGGAAGEVLAGREPLALEPPPPLGAQGDESEGPPQVAAEGGAEPGEIGLCHALPIGLAARRLEGRGAAGARHRPLGASPRPADASTRPRTASRWP